MLAKLSSVETENLYGKTGADLGTHNALVIQILSQAPHHLDLLLDRQTGNGILNHASHRCLVHGDETLVVHEREEAHDELAIHPVGDSTVSGYAVAEVFDLECPFETGGEEAAEGGDQGSKGGEDHDVELHGGDPEGVVDVAP